MAVPAHGPALPAALVGARAHLQGPSCPCTQGPTQERSALPQPFSSRDPGSPPCPLGRGRARPPAVPPWPAPALVCKDREAPASLSTQEGSAQCPRVPVLGPREPAPLPALASRGGQRAQSTQHLAGNTEGRRAREPTALPPPRCQRCLHTKAGGQHEGRALSCPSPQEEQTPPPATPPAPPSLPECQGPRNHVSSSQGGWPPRVCGLPGGASMPGHLRRRWTRLAGRPRKGGGAVRGPEPGSRLRQGRAVRTAGQEAAPTMPAARPVAGRRQVWGARPHPTGNRVPPWLGEWGDSHAAPGGRAGWQEAWARPFQAGHIYITKGQKWRRWCSGLFIRSSLNRSGSPAPCPALPFPLGLRSPPPCPARPDHMALAGSPFQYQPAKAAGSCRQMRAGFPAPPELQVLGEGSRGPGCLPPHHSRPGRPGHESRREVAAGARSPSLHAPPPPRARAARQVLRNVPRPGVRGGREASLQPASCLLPPAQLPAGRGGWGRGQPSLPAAQGPLVWGHCSAWQKPPGAGKAPAAGPATPPHAAACFKRPPHDARGPGSRTGQRRGLGAVPARLTLTPPQGRGLL